MYIKLTTYTTENIIQITEHRTQNTEYSIQHTEYRIQNTEYIMVLMLANPLLGQVGERVGPRIYRLFWAWHSSNGSMPFHGAQKSLDFQGSTHSDHRIGSARIKTITYVRGRINIGS